METDSRFQKILLRSASTGLRRLAIILRCIRPAMALCLILVALVSIFFTMIVYRKPLESNNPNVLTAGDTDSYVRLGLTLGTKDAETLCLLRTPGYPLIVRAVATLNGIDRSKVSIAGYNWSKVSEEGRKLVLKIITMNHGAGVLVTITAFLMGYYLTGRKWIGLLVSLAYILDIRGVTYQAVVLTETPSAFLFWLSCLAAVMAFRNPNAKTAIFYGLVTGYLILTRPNFLYLPGLFIPAVCLRFWFTRSSQTGFLSGCLRMLACACIPILLLIGAWSTHNKLVTGHFAFTQFAAYTLPNFATRHIVEMEFRDPDLQRLRDQFRQEYEADHDWVNYRIMEKSLGNPGFSLYHYNAMVIRASKIAIWKNLTEFLTEAEDRFYAVWRDPLKNMPNPLAYETASATPFLRTLLKIDGHLLFKTRALAAFLALGAFSIIALRNPWQRWVTAYLLLSVLLGIFLAVAADTSDFDRHVHAFRSIINGMDLVGIALLLRFVYQWTLGILQPSDASAR